MELPDNRGLKSFVSEFPPSPPKSEQKANLEDEANDPPEDTPVSQAGNQNSESLSDKEKKHTKGSQ